MVQLLKADVKLLSTGVRTVFDQDDRKIKRFSAVLFGNALVVTRSKKTVENPIQFRTGYLYWAKGDPILKLCWI